MSLFLSNVRLVHCFVKDKEKLCKGQTVDTELDNNYFHTFQWRANRAERGLENILVDVSCWPADLYEGKSLHLLPDVVLLQLRVAVGQLIVVPQEPLDVGHQEPHRVLHGRTGPQALSLGVDTDALRQGADPTDLQEQ